jgi:hypothetical protein
VCRGRRVCRVRRVCTDNKKPKQTHTHTLSLYHQADCKAVSTYLCHFLHLDPTQQLGINIKYAVGTLNLKARKRIQRIVSGWDTNSSRYYG